MTMTMKSKITIKLVGPRDVTIDAHVFGDWAAHAGIDDDDEPRLDWWVVTHVPNGRRIRSAGQMTEREAIDLARTLDKRKVKVPVYLGPTECVDLAELRAANPAFDGAAKIVRSVVFDTLGRCLET
jgi:hypothetical protein